METNTTENNVADNHLQFNASGASLFGLMLKNWLLNVVTLGLYYPWARVSMLKFYWQSSQLNGTNFSFTGTGQEIFKGFIKVLVFIFGIYGLLAYAELTENQTLYAYTILLSILFIATILPLAVHGAFRYRLSRTTWRGIHMGYRGNRSQLFSEFFIGYFFTIITFGIYIPWFIHRLRKYIIPQLRFGSLSFNYTGTGFDLFIIAVKGIVLSSLTFGLYTFWYKKDRMNYFVENCVVHQGDKEIRLRGVFSGWELFQLGITNFIILIFTLGIGTPWVILRTFKYTVEHIQIPSEIDLNHIAQTEDDYQDATGEYVVDFFDLGIV